jgi:hypothetical protein
MSDDSIAGQMNALEKRASEAEDELDIVREERNKLVRALSELSDASEPIQAHYDRLAPNHLVCDDRVVTSSDLGRALKAMPDGFTHIPGRGWVED